MTATRAAAKYNMPLKDVQARRKKETSKQESNKLLKKKKKLLSLRSVRLLWNVNNTFPT